VAGTVEVVGVVSVVVVLVEVVVVADVVVVEVSMLMALKGRRADAARAVATPRTATTPPSRRSEIARRIATECRNSPRFAPTDLGGCPCPIETATTGVRERPRRSPSPRTGGILGTFFDLELIDWPVNPSRNFHRDYIRREWALGSRGTRKACGACARLRALPHAGKDAGRGRDRDAHGSTRTGADHPRRTR
jgi:hypothetical protein